MNFPSKLAVLLPFLLVSCAKFPANGSSQGTTITFSFTMQEPVRTAAVTGDDSNVYIYAVALRATAETNPSPHDGPLPIQSSASAPLNGIATGNPGGGPTHLIVFSSQSPSSVTPYTLYSVASLPPIGDGSSSPIRTLTNFLPYSPPTDSSGGSTQLQFSVNLSDLVANQAGTGPIQNIQEYSG